jgi:TAT (twin-arginine translocation) pathway signal sequence
MNSLSRESKNNKNRRQFLKHGMVAAGAATLGTVESTMTERSGGQVGKCFRMKRNPTVGV